MVARFTDTTDMIQSEPTALRASEPDLIARARRGEPAAWRILVERHQSRVYALALQMVGNADQAQDIAQEVFVRLYRVLNRFNPDRRISTWMYRVTVNLAIDDLRRRSRWRGDTIEAADRQPLPDASAEQSDLRTILARIVAALPLKQRRVLVLRDLHGFSTAEVAGILDCRQSTVRVHLARARLRAKEVLTAEYPELAGGVVR